MVSWILWFLLIAALAAGTPLGLLFLIRRLNADGLFSIDILSLLIAVYTLEATVIIAVLIYYLQRKESQQKDLAQAQGGKRIISVELEAGLESAVRLPKAGVTSEMSSQLSQLLLAYLPYIQGLFQPEQLCHLIKLVDVFAHAVDLAAAEDRGTAAEYLENHLGLFVQEQFLPAMCSPYGSRFALIDDYRRVLNDETRDVLKLLSGSSLPQAADRKLTYKGGSPFLELDETGRCKIYDENGDLLCDAVLDEDSISGDGIESGWAKLENYVGEFEGGLRNGAGCSFSPLYHHKLFDGTWEDGQEGNGILFDMVIWLHADDSGDTEFEILFPYWNDTLVESEIMDFLMGEEDGQARDLDALWVGNVYQNKETVRIDDDFLCPLKEFMSKYDAKNLPRLEDFLRE